MALVVVGLSGREVGWAAATPSPAAHSTLPGDEPAKGLRYGGLRPAGNGERCQGQYAIDLSSGAQACTHGPDPAPAGVDVRQAVTEPSVAAEAAIANATLACQGDGVSGDRVQLLYAHPAGVADRYSSLLANFQLWAAEVDDVFNQSAAETGGTRHVRFVQDPTTCVPTVLDVSLSATGATTFANTINELQAQGYTRSDRKYLVWVDANVYCGIAQVYDDDSAAQTNLNNGPSNIAGMFARVDNGCWGQTNGLVEAHELTHTLGGVQPTAPNATPNNHCTDDYDRMCYVDATGVVLRIVCTDPAHENRLDCNHDDYYSTNPPSGSYLATHWNVANSAFLSGTNGTTTTTTIPPPTTTTSTTTSTTTTSTTTPTTTSTTSTTRPTTTTSTTRPPTTTTTVPVTTTTVPSSGAHNARFVTHAYQDLLGRAPTTAESSYWTNQLNGGVSRNSLAAAVVTGTEFRQDQVVGDFSSYLGRAPTSAELNAYVNAIAGGWTLQDVAAVIIGSPEYYALHGSTTTGFVTALYTQVFGVAVDANSLAVWVNALTTGGLDRTTGALIALTSSVEHQIDVSFAYQYFLHRAADANGLSAWTAQLDAGLREEYMFGAFVGSAEYYANV